MKLQISRSGSIFPDRLDPNVAARVMEELTQTVSDVPELDVAMDDSFKQIGQSVPTHLSGDQEEWKSSNCHGRIT